MEFDRRDRIILESLMQDCRVSIKELARRTRLTHPAVIYRIKRLENQKFIERYDGLINLNKVNIPIRMIFVQVSKKHSKSFENYCIRNSFFMTLARHIHKYNYSILAFLDENENKKFINYLKKKKFPYKFYTATKFDFAAFSIFDDVKIPRKQKKVQPKKLKLDKIDFKLIKIINHGGGRDSILELARKLKLNADLVLYRFKRLNKAGYFVHFLTQPNLEKFHIKYEIILFKVKDFGFHECFNIIRKIKRAAFFAQVGEGEYFITLVVKDLKDFEFSVEKIREEFDDNLIELEIYLIKNWIFLNRVNLEKFLTEKNN